MSEQAGKTITIDTNPTGGVSSVTVEQTAPDTGLSVGGVNLEINQIYVIGRIDEFIKSKFKNKIK